MVQIILDNLEYEDVDITSRSLAEKQALGSLIGGDAIIAFGERSDAYHDVGVDEFAVMLAQAVVGYLSSPKAYIRLFSSEFEDSYWVKILGEVGERCKIYRNSELICGAIPLLTILEGIREFINQVRQLIEELYGPTDFAGYLCGHVLVAR